MGRVLGIVALVAVVAAGGTVWLVARDESGRHRLSNARMVRRLSGASAAVVLVTLFFLRPWTWAVAAAGTVVLGLVAIHWLLRILERRPSPAGWGSIAAAMAAVVVGSGLVTLGGASAVVDGAALTGGAAVPVAHGGQVLARPVLYQVFWGPAWASPTPPRALAAAVTFERALPPSRWAAAVVGAGFGVRGFTAGGCWIDPSGPPGRGGSASGRNEVASSVSSGVFPAELARVLRHHGHLLPCPGERAVAVPTTLPTDAVVALWLDPAVRYRLGGVSVHSFTPWPGRPQGLAVVGLSGGFASWGSPACARRAACRALPPYAAPTYALSHEVVESATNPYGQGWYAGPPLRWSARYALAHGPTTLLGTAPAFEGEVADLCQPGQPDARRPLVGTLGPQALPTAPFYRPGTGCTTGDGQS